MIIKASCSDDAQEFGDALCENMPSKNMYSDKNDTMVDQSWNCYVDEVINNIPPPKID